MSRIADHLVLLALFGMSLFLFGSCVFGEVLGIVCYHLGEHSAGVIACGFATPGLYLTGRYLVWPTFLALF